ncbi:MAG: hypothetical protein HQM10_17990 [Candidatus Riflebacteria bacterium]|nr:hypothetical protein [Candidatus Riflebacteria bacterium]
MKLPDWLQRIREDRLRKSYRNPGLAGLMSFFVMGMGQVYAGYIDRGIIMIFIYLSGLSGGYSFYSKGVVFEFFSELFHPLALVGIFYVSSFIFILLWIYNIKEAYYLALFAGFREWFEIERVLIAGPTEDKGKWFLPPVFQGLPNEMKGIGVETEANLEADVEPEIEIIHEHKTININDHSSEKSKKNFLRRTMKHLTKTTWFLKWAFFLVIIGLISYLTAPYLLKKDAIKNTLSYSKQFLAPPTFKDETVISASMMLKSGNTASCAEFLEHEIESGNADEKSWKLLIQAREKLGDSVKFENALKAYLKEFPASEELLLKLAKSQFDRKSFVDAARTLSTLLNLNQNNILGNYYLGSIYRELGINDEAIVFLERCIKAEPLNPLYNLEYGQVLNETGKHEFALRFLEKCLSVEPSNETARSLADKIRDKLSEKLVSEEVTPQIDVPPPEVAPEVAPKIASQFSSQVVVLPESIPVTSENVVTLPSEVPETLIVSEKPKSTGGVVLFAAPGYEDKNPPVPQGMETKMLVNALGDASKDAKIVKPASSVESISAPEATIPEPTTPEMSTSEPPTQELTKAPERPTTPETTNAPEKAITPKITNDAEKSDPAKVVTATKKKPDDEYLISGIIDSEEVNTIVPDKSKLSKISTQTIEIAPVNSGSTVFEPVSIQPTAKIVKKKVVASDSIIAQPDIADTQKTQKSSSTGKLPEGKSAPPDVQEEVDISDEIAFAQAVEEVKPDRYSGILKKGRSRYLSGKWEESLPLLLEYLKHKPDGEVYGMVGNVFSKLGMLDDAFNASMRAYSLGYKDTAHLVRLGTLAESTGKFREGVQILSETLKKAPHRLDLRIKYVKCLIGSGYKEKAKSELNSVLASPNCSYSLKNLVQSELALLGVNTGTEVKK